MVKKTLKKPPTKAKKAKGGTKIADSVRVALNNDQQYNKPKKKSATKHG